MKTGKSQAIFWIGGKERPRGAVSRELDSLGCSLHWEPVSSDAPHRVAQLAPALVLVEANKVTARVKKILSSLRDLRESSNFVVFLIQEREPRRIPDLVDGSFLKGRGLVHQIKAVLTTLDVAGQFREESDRAQRQLRRAKRELTQLHKLVVRDDLTCLYNLRFFNRSIDTEHARATRFRRNYSLIFMDLDGLREVNTRYGHMAGGQVLKQLGEYLIEQLRRIDIPARVGGDEFVIICPETSKLSARVLADRLRQGIEDLKIGEDEVYPGITASVGVATFPEDGELPDQVLEKADRALYEAKARGKNRVCCWGDFPADRNAPRGSVHGDLPEDADDDDEGEADEPELETRSSS
jgi:diguanylate cyclase (GGDEF)-like protein